MTPIYSFSSLIIRADTEADTRRIASDAPGRDQQWLNPASTTCVKVDVDGEPVILASDHYGE